MADISLRGGLWIVLTTHSEGILRNVPAENVRLLTRAGGNVFVSTPKSATDYLFQLGIPSRKSGVIFVEDAVAQSLARVLVARFRPALLQEVEIHSTPNGAADVCAALAFPEIGSWFNIVGLLDGDESTKDHSHAEKLPHPHFYLPGTDPPETMLRLIAESRPQDVQAAMHVNEPAYAAAIGAAAGKNLHDWLPAFAGALGRTVDQVVLPLFNLWSSDPENERVARETFAALEQALGTAP